MSNSDFNETLHTYIDYVNRWILKILVDAILKSETS